MSTFLHSWMRTCREATTTILFSSPVMCTGPATCPAIIRLFFIFFKTNPANGAPVLVGIVISTTQRSRFARLPDDVALEAVEGSMMCNPVWSYMEILFAFEKLGFLTPDWCSSSSL